MSTAEILAELPKLSPAELSQIRNRLDDLAFAGADGRLTPEEKAFIDDRLAYCRAHPDDWQGWDDVRARLTGESVPKV